jgi:hypothetical protein
MQWFQSDLLITEGTTGCGASGNLQVPFAKWDLFKNHIPYNDSAFAGKVSL